MTTRLPLLALVAVVLVLPAAPAAAKGPLDSYCSPSGDYCTGVFREGGRIKLRISTFSFRGTYALCVLPPGGGRECHRFRLARKSGGLYGSRVDFARQFSQGAEGRYSVSWHYGGQRLGRVLHFKR